MTDLEKRFFSKEHTVSIQSGDEGADVIREVLTEGICKGDYYPESTPSKYNFSLDCVYSAFRAGC